MVEGIDFPDCALREDIVLIKRHQRAEGIGRQPIRQDDVGRAIAFANPERGLEGLRTLRREFFRSPAEGQRLGLREKFAIRRSCCAAFALSGWQNPIRSQGMSFVPWWMSW